MLGRMRKVERREQIYLILLGVKVRLDGELNKPCDPSFLPPYEEHGSDRMKTDRHLSYEPWREVEGREKMSYIIIRTNIKLYDQYYDF